MLVGLQVRLVPLDRPDPGDLQEPPGTLDLWVLLVLLDLQAAC